MYSVAAEVFIGQNLFRSDDTEGLLRKARNILNGTKRPAGGSERNKVARVSIEHNDKLLDGRAGVRVRAEWGHLSVLLGGGHICEFVSHAHPGVNPLWKPAWKTIDPQRYRAGEHKAIFGPPPDGALLAGIYGHSLSFDYFGPPSAEETFAGLTTHGEAPATQWKVRREFGGKRTGFEYGAAFPVSQIDFSRTLSVDPKRPVFYCEERARNLSAADRPISWTEHVTIGPPFLRCNDTLVDMPAARAKAIDASYSKSMEIVPGASFDWPYAPRPKSKPLNLRETQDGRYSRYTAQLIPSAMETGYVAASSPSSGLLLLYVFRRADFPWVGNWQESGYRQNAPWGGKTFCRGIEFSSTPFAIPKRETVTNGPLFGEQTYRWLPAKSEVTIRFFALLVEIPADFGGVERIALEGDSLNIHEMATSRTLTQRIDPGFLSPAAGGHLPVSR
jgi:hypothetical protein